MRTPTPLLFLLVSVVLLVAGCGGDGGGTTVDDTVASIAINPGSATLTSLGATRQLSASARTSAGGTASASFSWTSSAEHVAAVDANGLVTAVSNGATTITASASGKSGAATITVAQEAASIEVTLADEIITSGSTTQATATVTDPGGSAIAAPSLTWSASDEAVATVDSNGLVTGARDGHVTIAAEQDAASGFADLEVLRADLVVDEDMTIDGDLVAAEMSVAAGATLTLMGATSIEASGAVTIEGTIRGDCTALSLAGDATVTVSGTIQNSCVASPDGGDGAPALTIIGAGVTLDDSEIISSGQVTIEATGVDTGAALAAGSSMAESGVVSLVGATLRSDPVTAPESLSSFGTSRASGHRIAGSVRLNGTTIRAQDGWPGRGFSESSSADLVVRGHLGGIGGEVDIDVPAGHSLYVSDARGPSTLTAGHGGPGGPASATTTQNAEGGAAPSARSEGGMGGGGGSARISIDLESTIFLEDGTSDFSGLTFTAGDGGRGGNASATAADGVDADATRVAQLGGAAEAIAGGGGDATFAGGLSLFDDGGENEILGPPGMGGNATAHSGDGGRGSVSGDPDGAAGGLAAAWGGEGGRARSLSLGAIGGSVFASGGNGGDADGMCVAAGELSLSGTISVNSDPASSDQYIFVAGVGIDIGLVRRLINLSGPGGGGGSGGLLEGIAGDGGPGSDLDGPRADRGGVELGAGGNGGDGGPGNPGGSGGAAGLENTPEDDPIYNQEVFQIGTTGGSCSAASAVSPTVLMNFATREIQITGDAPWVDVTGAWDDESGVVSADGRGTVAGTPDILVEFEGTWDTETQTLTGTYTIDSEKVISSGHPIIYEIVVSGG